ncbi:MAG TPA: hypothetical protein VKR06_07690 [Ktedonosporobacter sp.]|nr:hypothetical protein [Ktedonosporobacter sp.]
MKRKKTVSGYLTSSLVALLTLLSLFLQSCQDNTPAIPQNTPAPASGESATIDATISSNINPFRPGMTDSDTSLLDPWQGNNTQAVHSARTLISQGLSLVNEPIMSWGADDPWPDPADPEPGNWGTLDAKLQMVHDTGATPVITLCEAPWWMKGQLNADGSTTLLTQDNDFSDISYASRILDNKMTAWLLLVRRTAERYMVAPYNVRYFQVWNELKGYYNPARNDWDVSTSPGNPHKSSATHGYTYMYNQVYTMLKKVAKEKGIDPASIQVGGPYVQLNTWSSAAGASNPSSFTTPYGVYDQRDLYAVMYWLTHKVGAEFITVDGSNDNSDNTNISDPFTAATKFADVVQWLRSLDEGTYPGARSLPVWWAEWYANPYSNITNAYNSAVKTYSMMMLIKAGGAVALEWGGTGDGTKSTGLWTSTSRANGGLALPWYYSYKAFRDDFGPGTIIYKTTTTSSHFAILATSLKTIVVNKTDQKLTIHINQHTSLSLLPYQVQILATPH